MQRVSVQSINSFSNEIITEMGRIYFILNKRDTADANHHLQCLFCEKENHRLCLCGEKIRKKYVKVAVWLSRGMNIDIKT